MATIYNVSAADLFDDNGKLLNSVIKLESDNSSKLSISSKSLVSNQSSLSDWFINKLIDIAKYERSAYPFAAYILTIIGISVASVKSREGVGKNLVIGLGFGLVYIFFMKMTTVAATNIGLYPIVAVWVPNLIFSCIALYLFYRRVIT